MYARVLYALAAVALLAGSAVAEDPVPLKPKPGRAAVEGRVEKYTGKHDLVIEIANMAPGQEAPPQSVEVDEEGGFRIPDMQPGSYRFVAVEKRDFDAQSARTDATIRKDEVASLVISFAPEEPAPQPIFGGTVGFQDGGKPKTFQFRLVPAEGGEGVLVTGEGGRFEVRLPPAGDYHVRDIVADGERCAPWSERTISVGPDIVSLRTHVFIARYREGRLLVVDEASGEPIPGARVYPWLGFPRFEIGGGAWSFPRPETLLETPVPTDAEGVAALVAKQSAKYWAVVADGYAWATIKVRHAKGAPTAEVPLVTGGRVRLRIHRWAALEDAKVEFLSDLAPARGDPCEVVPDSSGSAVVEGLLPGRYTFEVKRRTSPGGRYGRGEVVVRAAKVAELRIDAKPGPPVTHVKRFAVVLQGAADWGVELESVHLKGADLGTSGIEMEFLGLGSPDESGGYRFEAENLVAGRYHLLVEPIGWRAVLDVAKRVEPLHLPLGKPASVSLHVVAADSAEDVREAQLLWHVPLPDLVSYRWRRAITNEDVGLLAFRCPAGRVRIRVDAPGFLTERFALWTEAGAVTERTVEMRPAGALTFRFVEDGKVLEEWPDTFVTIARGTTDWSYRGNFDTGNTVPPGIYRLTVRPMAGYEPVPSREIRLEGGKTLVVTIDLVQKAR